MDAVAWPADRADSDGPIPALSGPHRGPRGGRFGGRSTRVRSDPEAGRFDRRRVPARSMYRRPPPAALCGGHRRPCLRAGQRAKPRNLPPIRPERLPRHTAATQYTCSVARRAVSAPFGGEKNVAGKDVASDGHTSEHARTDVGGHPGSGATSGRRPRRGPAPRRAPGSAPARAGAGRTDDRGPTAGHHRAPGLCAGRTRRAAPAAGPVDLAGRRRCSSRISPTSPTGSGARMTTWCRPR